MTLTSIGESMRGRKAPKHGSFRVKFSALSLGGNASSIFQEENISAFEETESLHKESEDHEGDVGSTIPCFVTFSLNVYYKEHSLNDDWQLCSTVETKPILGRFKRKPNGLVMCLLRHTERMPLFLNSKITSVNSHDGKGYGEGQCSSTSEQTSDSAPKVCRGSNHLLESHRFKIAVGVAVIKCGKVVYVGHGWRNLRAIDLFGKRISLIICGDSCNTNDHSMDCITIACLFFDIHVKYVQWVPCTEHCRLFHEFTEESSMQQHLNNEASSLNPHNIGNPLSVEMDVASAVPHDIDSEYDMWDVDGEEEDASRNYSYPESHVSTFRNEDSSHSQPLFRTAPPSTYVKPSVKSSVYVGSDPKYRISVLDINTLSGNLKKSAKVEEKACRPPHRRTSADKRELHEMSTSEDPGCRLSSMAPDVAVVETSLPINGNEKHEANTTDDNGSGFLNDLLRTVFGGDDKGAGEGTPHLKEPAENMKPKKSPLETSKHVRRVGNSIKIGSQEIKMSCLLKIGREKDGSLDPSILQSIQVPLNSFIDQLARISDKIPQKFRIRRIWLRPYDIGMFVFTVNIPDEHASDLAYAKKALDPFHKLPSSSIVEIAFLFDVYSSMEGDVIDKARLKSYLQDIQLECGMTVQHVEMGSNLNVANVFNHDETCEPITPLRKCRSDTYLCHDALLSKTVEGTQNLDHLRCFSARDDMAVDTWINTMNHILLSNNNNELIQITSPRTSLPICIDQKWVVFLRQLLSNIKKDSGPYQPSEAVKFIWPT